MLTGRKPGGKKTGGRDFVAGDPDIPRHGGSTKLSPEQRASRELSKKASFDIVHKYAWMTRPELATLNLDELPLYEAGILKSFITFAKTGSLMHIQFWLDHLVGRPAQPLSNPDGSNLFGDFKHLSDMELDKRIEAIVRGLKE